jgi:hypothetical protein
MIAGLVVFVLIDVALVAWAFTATHSTPHQQAAPIPTFSRVPETPRPTPTATATAPVASVTAAPRLLAAVNGTIAYRATRGSCTGADAVLERTADGGATWQALDTARDGIHTIARIYNVSDTRVSLVAGAGDDCSTQGFASFTGGRFWEPADDLGDQSYIDPDDPSSLHVASDTEAAPCAAPLQLAEGGDSTAVLCSDGVRVRSAQGEWQSAPMPGALAVAATDAGYDLAAAGVQGCAGVAIESFSAQSPQPQLVGCAASATPDGATLAVSGTTVWLWSGTSVLTSSDGGASW